MEGRKVEERHENADLGAMISQGLLTYLLQLPHSLLLGALVNDHTVPAGIPSACVTVNRRTPSLLVNEDPVHPLSVKYICRRMTGRRR